MKQIKLPSTRKYPKKIYFSNECYTIKFKKNLGCFGITDPNDKTITINEGMSERATLETFIHELCHVIEMELPVKMKHSKIYKWEQGIMQMILDNFL